MFTVRANADLWRMNRSAAASSWKAERSGGSIRAGRSPMACLHGRAIAMTRPMKSRISWMTRPALLVTTPSCVPSLCAKIMNIQRTQAGRTVKATSLSSLQTIMVSGAMEDALTAITTSFATAFSEEPRTIKICPSRPRCRRWRMHVHERGHRGDSVIRDPESAIDVQVHNRIRRKFGEKNIKTTRTRPLPRCSPRCLIPCAGCSS
jgi:hypothetical protein